MSTPRIPSTGLALALISAGLLSPLAHAQQQPQQLERVEVVGSNIKRITAEGPLAIEVVKRDAIEASGKATVADLLNDMSSVTSLSKGDNGSSFAPGAANVGLRNMGAKNVLILLNGRRVANFGYSAGLSDSAVDLNTLPLNAIESIEILRDGASAIYGSDAVAGVINFKTRQNFKGLDGSLSYAANQAGDSGTTTAGLTGGVGDLTSDRFNLLFNLDLFKMDKRELGLHEWSKSNDLRPFGGRDNRASNRGPGSYEIRNSTAANTRFAMPGCPKEQIGIDDKGSEYCYTDLAAGEKFGPALERVNLSVLGKALITENLELFGELGLSRNTAEWDKGFSYIAYETKNFIQPSWATWDAKLGTLPNGSKSPLAVFRAIEEAGQVNSKLLSNSMRALGGARGVFGNWDWESAALYSSNKVSTDETNRLKSAAIVEALKTGSYNPWITANPLDKVLPLMTSTHREAKTTLSVVDFKMSNSELFTLGGPVGFAWGLQAMRDTLKDTPDGQVIRGEIEGLGGTGAEGSRRTVSAYGEFNLQPIKQIEIQAALRHDQYNDFGGTTNPKLAIAFRPSKEVLIRGNFNTAFKAPSLPELYMSESKAYTTVADWVRCKPLGYDVKSCKYSPELKILANPELKPERTKIFALGLALQPTSDLFASFDVYRLEQKDTISILNAQYLLDNEFTVDGFKDMVIRDPRNPALEAANPGLKDGRLKGLVTPYRNVGRIETTGIDIALKARFKLPFGILKAESQHNHTFSYKQSDVEGRPLSSRLNGYERPNWKNVTFFSLKTGDLESVVTAITKAGVLNYGDPSQAPAGTEIDKIGAYTSWNLGAIYQLGKKTKLNAQVVNVFDATPRFSSHYNDFLDSETGRGFSLKLEHKFF